VARADGQPVISGIRLVGQGILGTPCQSRALRAFRSGSGTTNRGIGIGPRRPGYGRVISALDVLRSNGNDKHIYQNYGTQLMAGRLDRTSAGTAVLRSPATRHRGITKIGSRTGEPLRLEALLGHGYDAHPLLRLHTPREDIWTGPETAGSSKRIAPG